MNFWEAYKSGKAFKRWHETQWQLPLKHDQVITLDKVMLDAMDWEIKEEKKELSKQEILKAYIDAVNAYDSKRITLHPTALPAQVVGDFLKRLGFTE